MPLWLLTVYGKSSHCHERVRDEQEERVNLQGVDGGRRLGVDLEQQGSNSSIEVKDIIILREPEKKGILVRVSSGRVKE